MCFYFQSIRTQDHFRVDEANTILPQISDDAISFPKSITSNEAHRQSGGQNRAKHYQNPNTTKDDQKRIN